MDKLKAVKVIEYLIASDFFSKKIAKIEKLGARKAEFGQRELNLAKPLIDYLERVGIKLYSHQTQAIEYLQSGGNVIITTPTASGKTLAFNLPVFDHLYRNPQATALYLYPAKALSNDQLVAIKEIEKFTRIKTRPAVYDGDTPSSKRARIRNDSRIIISNPYELHQVLPWHTKWRKFLKNLSFIVLDEAHRYRGVFGSNIAYLIRRLRRICNYYGSSPQFVISSATLANPLEFASKLTGLEFNLVDKDGSPTQEKYFVLYNPFYDGEGELSVHEETQRLFSLLVRSKIQTLCFTLSRKLAELIASWSQQRFKIKYPRLAGKITPYRAGYLPKERRQIEQGLKDGELLGVVSTNALELGIDIGSLDAVIISGYPGTFISVWQQAGRAGRKEPSMVILVAFQNPLDQYIVKHPESIFQGMPEHAIIDLDNEYIFSGHVLCATAELPCKPEVDRQFLGNKLDETLQSLTWDKIVKKVRDSYIYVGSGRAVDVVQLDGISSERFTVVCDGKVLETLSRRQAYNEAHTGAVLLHRGETYLVTDMDLQSRIIRVMKKDVDFYTTPLRKAEITVLETLKRKRVGEFLVLWGEIKVEERYTGYVIKKYNEAHGKAELNLPPLIFNTQALWFTVPQSIRSDLLEKELSFAGGLHGVEHAMIGLMPFYVMCDRWDLGGVSTLLHPDTSGPTIFIYDGYEGGIGLTERGTDLIEQLIRSTYELINDCKCDEGCPGCIYSPKCGNDNQPLDKQGSLAILNKLLKVMGTN